MTDHDDTADVALSAYAPELDEPEDEAPAGPAAPDAVAAQSMVLTAERDQLTRVLRDTQRQLVTVEAELRAAKGSATMKLGAAVVAAAKRPWIGGPRLPVHLYRMWRQGRGLRSGPGPGAGTGRSGSGAARASAAEHLAPPAVGRAAWAEQPCAAAEPLSVERQAPAH